MNKIEIKKLGLTTAQVEESRRLHGANLLTPPPKASVWSQFIEKFNDPLIKILLVALLLSIGISFYEVFSLGKGLHVFLEPAGIFVAIMLATVIGFILELSANKKFEMLSKFNDDIPVKVMRNGAITQVPRRDIVVGDIVLVEAGEKIPADGTLLDSVSLIVNESSLTGEPSAVKSHLPEMAKPEATYPTNMLLRGSSVSEGSGVLRIERVGDATEYGKVFESAQIDNGVKTPLSLQLERLGKLISYASYAIGALIVVGRLAIYDYAPFEIFDFINYFLVTIMLAVTLIVVSVPEGLPMSITLSLALSMRRMLATNNLVRKMHACETMGATTVICTDKTGTLTQNRMSVHEAMFAPLKQEMTESIACNSSAHLDRTGGKVSVIGNPTEGALLLWLDSEGTDYLAVREQCRVISQVPFSTERKFMATEVESPVLARRMLYVKGAPEILIRNAAAFAPGCDRATIEAKLAEYQGKAMRTLGFAYAEVPADAAAIVDGNVALPLTFIGITAISDPVREEVPDAIKMCVKAGIDVKIVTGDTPGTAMEIGRQVGLWSDSCTASQHISGPDFATLSDDEASKIVKALKIMSRARPSDKARLVQLLQQQREVVAVTGDGTNDAPALNAAQVGLSMGDGTSVAKEASDITILDNSFASITRAVMWGRSLYQNIQRFILFQLTVNVVACLIVLIGAFTSKQSPLTVTQMLWVNLIMDTFAALALSSLPPSEEVMDSKPRRPSDFIITRSMAWFIIGIGLAFVAVLFGFMQYLHQCPLDSITDFEIGDYFANFFNFHYSKNDFISAHELTYFFTFFVALQFWNLFNAKSFMTGHTAFYKATESKVFFFTLLMIFFGQILIIYCGGEMFNVEAINFVDFLCIFAVASVVWIGGEVFRSFRRLRKL